MSKALVIMAAGMGSRFGGDKQVISVGPSGQFLMEYSVFDALKAGFNKIIFIIRPGMQTELSPIVDSMRSSHPEAEFIFAEQTIHGSYRGIPIPAARTKPLGTVHAVLSAEDYIDGPFAVINADDFYGREAFRIISTAIDRFISPNEAAMAAYSLKNTLSKHGAVTRGVCSVENGKLLSIREAYKVSGLVDGSIFENIGYASLPLPSTSPVSMNMWAFSNGILPEISAYFSRFLRNLDNNDNKSECLLPIMVQNFISHGLLSVEAYPTDCRWFGLTYKEDAEDAAWELDKRHQDGTYPDKLF